MSEYLQSWATFLSTMGGLALFVFFLTRKSFWKTIIRFKLMVTFFLSYAIFSLPGLFSWAELHSLFGFVYAFFNLPLIYLNDVGVIDLEGIEWRLFERHTLETANATFGMVSIVFWTIVAYITGGVIDLVRKRLGGEVNVTPADG